MERRLYFIIGDLLTCLLAGAGAGWFVCFAVPADWHMVPAMAVGMVLGMVAGMACGLFLTPLFGAMEVMLAASLAGMVAGMLVAMFPGGAGQALAMGGGAGLACLVLIYLLQAKLHGEADHE